jgi:acetyltransferase-like isoleucine patch superfamily enzyme
VLITTHRDALIEIGPDCRLNGTYVLSASSVTFGEACLVADAHIFDTDHHVSNHVLREQGAQPTPRPIRIGSHVWICSRAAILKGVHIGEGAVVGYRAVVRRDVPPRAVVIGNPAQVVKRLGGNAEPDAGDQVDLASGTRA